LECKLRVTTSESLSKLYFYANQNTKIVDQASAKEYFPLEVIVAGQAANYGRRIEKELVNNIPVEVVYRFEPKVDITVIGRLAMSCYSSSWFIADISDIFVQ